MDSDWQQVRQIQLSPPNLNQYAHIIATIAFDTHQELLWIGDEFGHVSSYYGSQLEKYTSLQAHLVSEGHVEQFLFNERGVISLASRSVHFMNRRCLTQWHIEENAMRKLCCMTFVRKDSPFILVAGCQRTMYKIDVEKGRVVEEIAANADYTMMKLSRYVCAATSTGSVDFLDPGNFQVIKTWQAHNSKINSMDVKTDYLLTCGWSTKSYGAPQLETIVKVFDIKKMEVLAPMSFPAGAAFVQIHPRMSTTTLIASQHGQLHLVDFMNPDNAAMLHVQLMSVLTSMIISPSGNVWAIMDQDNAIHLWGSPEKLQFTETLQPTEFADEVLHVPPVRGPRMAVDDDLPLNTIGMPFYREMLLSAWGNDRSFEVGRPPAVIDPEILKNLRPNPGGIGQIAPNPRKVFRNQVEQTKPLGNNGTAFAAPKLLSEKARDPKTHASNGSPISRTAEALLNTALSDNTRSDVPNYYVNLTIKFGLRLGIDDFDFKYYNKTRYSGLTNTLMNSYLNPLLQLLRFTPLVRNLALHHAAGSCAQDCCLLCEIGFLCDMLERSRGKWCQATNFLLAYRSLPEAAQLHIVEESSPRNTLDVRISIANRFLLQQICRDSRRVDPYDSTPDQTFITNGLVTLRCLNCNHETFRHDASHVTTLTYPEPNAFGRTRFPVPKFSDVLSLGFQNESQTKGWCQRCRRYAPLANRRTITDVSPILMINTGLDKSPKNKQIWSKPRWLPQEIGITIEGGSMRVLEGESLQPFRYHRSTVVFELVGLVADVTSADRQQSHLVSFINVAISERSPREEGNQWHLLNDFLVRKVEQDEALEVTPWKTPVILTYQVRHARNNIDDSWKDSLDLSCLYYNGSLNIFNNPEAFTLKPGVEVPRPGTQVAIDAEFVMLVREELEITADGTKVMANPKRNALGRVSVLRVGGEDEGIPFIDDYITVKEPIVDYLTQYSGIEEGDLDPSRSKHALVSLKNAYKKLWLLLNLGCIFVGHGLVKDFFEANMHVPKEQVIDTANLFLQRDNPRRLKLAMLAELLLREEVQTGNHDSVEDARTALLLWRKYQEFEDAGIVEQVVNKAYRDARKTGYVPRWESEAVLGEKFRTKTGMGGSSADLVMLGGRVTPEVGAATGSGTVTPGRRGRQGGEGEGIGYFESPLK